MDNIVDLFVAGDTAPVLSSTQFPEHDPGDLTGAVVLLRLKRPSKGGLLLRQAVVTDNIWSYEWQEGELVKGAWHLDVEVTKGGELLTLPTPEPLYFRVRDRLSGSPATVTPPALFPITEVLAAQAAAEDAADAAQLAQSAAEGASGAAQSAQSGAEDARDAAVTARDDAQDARDAAQTARDGVEDARDAAVAAQGEAEGARDAAQAAQGAAEGAQGAAEDARDAALAGLALAEANAAASAQAADESAGIATEAADRIGTALAAMLAKSQNLSDVASPSAARANLGAAAAAHQHAQADVTGLTGALAAKADLVNGVVPTSQIPSRALVNAVPVTDEAAMLALTSALVQPGDIAIRSDGGGTWMLTEPDPSTLDSWVLLAPPTSEVTSVNGQVGTVVLGAADVGAATPAEVASAVDAVEVLAAGYAASAQGSAESASSSAGSAAGSAAAADTARGQAVTAKTDAETARTDSLQARTDAQSAAGTATTQAGLASTARTAAEAARDLALTYRDQALAQNWGGVAIAAGVHLDSMTTPGAFYQGSSGNALLTLGYPVLNVAGHLTVLSAGSAANVWQMFHPLSIRRVFYERHRVAGTWTSWRCFASQRTDTTAGRALYGWDEVNNRETLIGYESGHRDCRSLLATGVTGLDGVSSALLSRSGRTVTLQLGLLWSNWVAGTPIFTVPVGFRPVANIYLPGSGYAGNVGTLYLVTSGQIYSYTASSSSRWLWSWPTNEVAPTSLPGDPVGTIPYL